ncbi:uncharacterized protein BJ171DRAFT_510430 [Polychytrium aggregatum]|uniref:uncharacterized protein n=1 Tax=Polychytrium aggregatum TaxID=110093 RepID=UPI0022FDD573|nr:uncharacterized protein BJ171DRAFT_510430 [Polychytrium aggregatum]KAI9203344.1 hypothetical protein BJ171DRAFT_510430 [Polychytrium aggregatum]
MRPSKSHSTLPECLSCPAGVPIDFLLNTKRLSGFPNDDAVIAKALRAHASASIEVNKDGRRIRRKSPANVSKLAELDSRTIYLERLPPNSTADDIRGAVAALVPVSSVCIPFEGRNGADRTLGKFAFVRLERQADVANAVQALNTMTKLTPRMVSNQAALPPGERLLRCLDFASWRSLSEEYQALLEYNKNVLRETLEQQINRHGPAVFEQGVVAEFTGTHSQTNTKTLKRMFESVAPVAYLDCRRSKGSGRGHVRFKTPYGAQLAELYFKRESIVQIHGQDIGTLYSKAKQSMAHRSNQEPGPQHDPAVRPDPALIKLRIIRGDEERQYWSRIQGQQHEKYTEHDEEQQHGEGVESMRTLDAASTSHVAADSIAARAKDEAPPKATRAASTPETIPKVTRQKRHAAVKAAPVMHVRFDASEPEDDSDGDAIDTAQLPNHSDSTKRSRASNDDGPESDGEGGERPLTKRARRDDEE